MYIRIGTKVSALSSFRKCRISPAVRRQYRLVIKDNVPRTKDDLATVQDTNEFIPRGFIVIDLQQLCNEGQMVANLSRYNGLTLLSEHQEPFTPLSFRYV